VNLTIEKMIYGGDGLARRADGKTVFLPFVLPGEEVAATILEEKTGFSRATLKEIVHASARRGEADCPYFAGCGGCHYQHTDYDNQLEIKSSILRETLLRTAKIKWEKEIAIHSDSPWNYRNRTRVKVQAGKDFALGYHRFSSNSLLPVRQCPISSPLINKALGHVWQLGESGRVPQGVVEIEFFAGPSGLSGSSGPSVPLDETDTCMLLEVSIASAAAATEANLREFARDMQVRMTEIKGVVFFPRATQGGFLSPKAVVTVGQDFLSYPVGDKAFRVSAGSFFQTNRYLVPDLAKVVAADLHGKTALDLYAGVGLFANHLSKRFDQVFAVESSAMSGSDLEANAQRNVTPVRSTAEQFLPKCHNLRPELVVVDPPRAGLGDKATKLLASLRAPKIGYLSCDPTTLARDLRLLVESGYRIEEVKLFDLFPQTFHVETFVRLER